MTALVKRQPMVMPNGMFCAAPGTLATAPATASTTGLHVVANTFIPGSSLSGAAVIAFGDMWAVGTIGTGSGPFQALAEHFSGSSWSVVPAPALNGSLAGVSGAASNNVWAVGTKHKEARSTR